MSTSRRLRSLYVCYLSLDDPLVHTQVVAYLRGLVAAGHHIHLLTFETSRLTRAHRRRLRASMAQNGIRWHGLRYHKRPSLPATVYDALAGAVFAGLLVRRYRLDTLHARNHVPAAMALIARRLAWPRRTGLIFDIRGLMAEEYEDAGRWRRGNVPFRLTKAVERVAIRRADGIVVLTERIRRALFGENSTRRVSVIPCCADLEALAAAAADRQRVRAELGFDGATVMVYVGKFGGWYMAAEMADFFTVARESIPRLHFLILTQDEQDSVRRELQQRHLTGAYTLTSAPPEELGRYLAAADFGVSFIRPTPSKASSSPTKIGEYLGAGLPVVSTSGIGDVDALISSDVGCLVSEHTGAAYRAAAQHVSRLLTREDTRNRCCELAQRELSLVDVGIPRYRQLYEKVPPIGPGATLTRSHRASVPSDSAYPSPRTPALSSALPKPCRTIHTMTRPLRPLAERVPRGVVNSAKACLGRTVSWNLDALATLWGTDKAPAYHGYTAFYARHLRTRRRSIRSVLEIGIGGYEDPSFGGHSLFMWRSYFPKATIYGVDVYPKHLAGDARIVTLCADQSDVESLQRVLKVCPQLDFIVDDGSHVSSDIVSSFEVLFPALAPGGLYAIEDIAMAYDEEYGGSPPGTSDALALYKSLFDDINLGGPRHVASVHVYPELVIVEKGA